MPSLTVTNTHSLLYLDIFVSLLMFIWPVMCVFPSDCSSVQTFSSLFGMSILSGSALCQRFCFRKCSTATYLGETDAVFHFNSAATLVESFASTMQVMHAYTAFTVKHQPVMLIELKLWKNQSFTVTCSSTVFCMPLGTFLSYITVTLTHQY